jgi:hypothetical protein
MAMNIGEVRSTEGIPEVTERALGESRAVQSESASRNAPQRAIDNLKASLPKMHDGGVVPKDGAYNLQAGEQVTPASQTAQPDSPAPAQDDSNLPEEPEESGTAGSINLQRAYSKLNQAVRAMLDGLGIRRSATIPHQMGQSMSDHLSEIGQVMATKGNISGNILTATHSLHAGDGGSTVAHPNEPLQKTIIPKDFEPAKTAINACRTLVNKVASLIGKEDPSVKLADSQLQMISKNQMQGMSAFDAAVALLNIPGPMIKTLARKHSEHKHGTIVAHLTGPKK